MVKKRGGQSRGTAKEELFFKFLVGDISTRLPLPPKFVQHISWESTRLATILGPTGVAWPVDFRKGPKNEAFFEGGWHKFVEDNSLEEGDFVLLKYDGNMHFTVKIFGKNACEKEIAFAVNVGKEGRGKSLALDKIPMDSEGQSHSGPNTQNIWKFRTDHRGTCHGATVKIEEELYLPPQGLESHRQSMRVQEKELQMLKKSKTFSMNNPYFKRTMTGYIISQNLYLLPKPFANTYLPEVNTNITLRGPDGEACLVKHNCGRDGHGRVWLEGWLNFVWKYMLKVGETCFFEVVSELEMKVHIMRGTKEEPC